MHCYSINQKGSNPLFRLKNMIYIAIETHGGPQYATICTDENGNILIFKIREDAEPEAADCQDGLVVEI